MDETNLVSQKHQVIGLRLILCPVFMPYAKVAWKAYKDIISRIHRSCTLTLQMLIFYTSKNVFVVIYMFSREQLSSEVNKSQISFLRYFLQASKHWE